jgi:multidrug efflux system membrane fusion protein
MSPSTTRLVLVLAALASWGCETAKKAAGPPPQRPPSPVTAAVAVARDVPEYLDEIGRCAPAEMVVIKPLVAGRITAVHVSDGASVKQGDLLFTIDPRPYEHALEQTRANVAQQKAVLALAKAQVERYEALLKTNGLSRQEVEEKKSNLLVAEAQVASARAAVGNAELNVEYCTIRSPIEGRAGRRLMDVGNLVKANGDEPLLMIERMHPIKVEFSVTESDFAAVQRAQRTGPLRVEVRLPEDASHARTGELTFIDNTVDAATGTVKLRATLDNADHILWPGLFVKVRLILSVLKSAVLVPSAAVQVSAKGPFVYVIAKDSTAELRQVKTGQPHGELVVVLEGVKASERVVTLGHLAVAPGAPVRVEEPAASPSPSPSPSPRATP